MSLLILSDDLPPQAVFEPFKQAQFMSQILPAYKMGIIGADEIYFLSTYTSPVAACPLYNSKFRGYDRTLRLI